MIEIPILIYNLSKIQREILNKTLKVYQLDFTQGLILYKIETEKTLTSKELIDMGIVEKSAISKILNRMEKLGYIIKKYTISDKRKFHIVLTESGKQIVKIICKLIKEYDKKIKTILSENTILELNELLKAFD